VWGALLSLACTAAVHGARADARPCVSVSSPEEPLSPGLLASFDELVARAQLRRVDPRDVPASCARNVRLRLVSSPYAVAIHAESVPPDGREVERRVPRDGDPVVFEETLAHALYGALSPWLTDDAARSAIALRLLLALGASYFGAPGFDAQAWLGAAVVAEGRFSPELALRGGFAGAPSEEGRRAITHRAGKLRLLAGMAALERPRLRVRGALGLGVDLVAARARNVGPAAELTRSLEPVWALAGLCGVDVPLSPALSLGLEVGVDLMLRRLRYVVDDGGVEHTWLTTRRAQPFAQLTLHAEPFARLRSRGRP
jgi:hypothetical protein